jgi:hypothetical protein
MLNDCDAVGLVGNGQWCAGVHVCREAVVQQLEPSLQSSSSMPWAPDRDSASGCRTCGASVFHATNR